MGHLSKKSLFITSPIYNSNTIPWCIISINHVWNDGYIQSLSGENGSGAKDTIGWITKYFFMSYLNQTCMKDNLNCIIAVMLHITFTLTLTEVFSICKTIVNCFSISLVLWIFNELYTCINTLAKWVRKLVFVGLFLPCIRYIILLLVIS